ncbi:hypothetical protein MMC17_009098 [Xylographa soralifera]|nr:hypothetical protein [Xylographa soralifera]
MIQLPQRFQTVNATTPLGAGIRLLPYTLFSPVGTILAAQLMSKYKVHPLILLELGAVFSTIGIALLSTVSASEAVQAAQYGYQILAGFGNGISVAITTLLVPPAVEKRDLAVGTSAAVQFRLVGGMIGVALVTCVMNASIRPKLLAILSMDTYQELLQSTSLIETFQPPLQATVRSTYADGYNLQMKITIGFAAAQILAAFLLWPKGGHK